jgi:hypothetical protein
MPGAINLNFADLEGLARSPPGLQTSNDDERRCQSD